MSTAAGTIRILCACGKKLNAPAGSEGRKARCPACGASLVVGAAPAAQPQAAAARAPVAAARASAGASLSGPAPAAPTRATAVAERPAHIPVAALAPTPPARSAAEDDDDPFKALCDAADEMAMAPVEEVPRCPQCHSAMGGGAVVCVKCGYDSRTGQRLITEAVKKPSRLTLAYGGGKKDKVVDAMAPDGSFLLGLVLSAAFALTASLVWIGVAWATGRSFALIAILIGAAAGLGMQAGHRGYSALGGFAAGGVTFATILTAKFAVLYLVILPHLNRLGGNRTISDLSAPALGLYFFSPIGFIIMVIGMGAAFKTANGSSS
jgi:hypothetical protein